MNIRYATKDDASMLAELGRKTFYDTFINENTPEDMEKYLTEHYSSDIQLSEIVNPDTVFLIAELNSIALGYIKLHRSKKGDGVTGINPLELQRIYTVREYIGKGVGPELMKTAINETKERGFDSLWLGVWEKNERAIKFYEKWGFKKVGNQFFVLGNDIQNDFTMELRIKT